MSGGIALSRRSMLAGPILLPIVEGAAAGVIAAGSPEILVAFLSRTGNTSMVAGQIRRARGATLFEIRPATPYPEDYEKTVEQARRERQAGYEPPLKASVPGMAGYRTVYLGFPIWGGSLPPPIRSFLAGYDWAGKELRPFITHGGYGVGDSQRLLREQARGATIRRPFSMRADQERQTLEQVTKWLEPG